MAGRTALTESFVRQQAEAVAAGRFFELASLDTIQDGQDLTTLLREIADEVGPMMGARPMRKVRVLITYDKDEG